LGGDLDPSRVEVVNALFYVFTAFYGKNFTLFAAVSFVDRKMLQVLGSSVTKQEKRRKSDIRYSKKVKLFF
jgi:hypothetical protein